MGGEEHDFGHEPSELAMGYRIVRDYMRLRSRDPIAAINDHWTLIEQVHERMAAAVSDVPGLVYRPPSPLMVAAQLLVAFEDFVESVNPDSRLSPAFQLESRAELWERAEEASFDEDDDDDEWT